MQELNLTYLWQNVSQPPVLEAPDLSAADAMGQLICNNPDEITLVVIGPLTNVACAMQRYPNMADAVVEIVIMGGVFAIDNYLKDTNFGMDPEAVHIVLRSRAKITIIPMDVTTRTLMTHDDLDGFEQIKTPLARYICETTRPWMQYSMVTRNLTGCWIHDALVVAWLIDQHVGTATEYRVGIELRAGTTRGKCWRYKPPLRLSVGISESAGAIVHILQTVDNRMLLNMIENTLSTSSTI